MRSISLVSVTIWTVRLGVNVHIVITSYVRAHVCVCVSHSLSVLRRLILVRANVIGYRSHTIYLIKSPHSIYNNIQFDWLIKCTHTHMNFCLAWCYFDLSLIVFLNVLRRIGFVQLVKYDRAYRFFFFSWHTQTFYWIDICMRPMAWSNHQYFEFLFDFSVKIVIRCFWSTRARVHWDVNASAYISKTNQRTYELARMDMRFEFKFF